MAFGSSEKSNIKTKRISSSSIINNRKKNTLVKHFNFVKNFKNNISYYIFNHKAMLCNEDSKKELASHFKNFKTPELYSWEIQKIFHQSIDFYSNWMDKLIINNKFILQKEFKITYYKKKVVNKNGELLSNKGDVKDKNACKNIRNRIFEEVLRFDFHDLKKGQYVPKKMKRETVQIKLTALFEVDNERQREDLVSNQETSSFRAR